MTSHNSHFGRKSSRAWRTLRGRGLMSRAVVSTFFMFNAIAVSLSIMFLLAVRAALDSQACLRAQELTSFFAAQSQYPLLVADTTTLRQIAATAVAGEGVVSIRIEDASGEQTIAAHRQSASVASQKRSAISRILLTRSRILDVNRPVTAPTQGGMHDWESKSLPRSNLGLVRVEFSLDKADELFRHVILRAAITIPALFIVFVPFLYWDVRRVLLPLQNLIDFTRRVGSSNLTARATVARNDEVGELTICFNQMLDQLSSTTVSRDYVDAVLQCMAESLIVVDDQGQIRTANHAAVQMLGYEMRELIGLRASTIRPSWFSAREDKAHVQSSIDTYHGRNGLEIPVLLSSSRLLGSNLWGGATIWLAQDMTEIKRTQEQLIAARDQAEMASEAKSRFLAAMSHELRTPLNAILGFSQLLDLELADEGLDRWSEDIQKIIRSGNHLLALINDVLDLSKVDAGKMQLLDDQFDIVELAREVIEQFEPAAAANRNHLSLIVAPDLARGAPARGDRRRTLQCLLNLVANACKFTSDGRVTVHVARQIVDSSARYDLSVEDTGIGIAPDDLKRLFNEFAQVDGSTTRKYGGTGLGLALSRRLARVMGGEITVTSSPGAGSVFTLSIPRVASVSAPSHGHTSSAECLEQVLA